MPPTADTVSPAGLRAWPLPKPSGGKGSRGRVVVVGGAATTPGAVMLAGLAALRVGAGVLTLGVAESVAAAVGAAVPEAGVEWLPQNAAGSVLGTAAEALAHRIERASALLVGPGLDDIDETVQLITGLVDAAGDELNFVLDAYALGAIPPAAGHHVAGVAGAAAGDTQSRRGAAAAGSGRIGLRRRFGGGRFRGRAHRPGQ